MSDPSAIARVVAFDVDHTITTRDCVLPFMRRVAGPLGLATGLVRQPVPALRGVMARDRDALKAVAARAAFRDRPLDQVTACAERFARDVASDRLRGEVVARLRAHLDAGDVVVLVSASFEVYVRPLGEHLAVADVIATRLEASDGRLTGGILGANCRGPEKVARLHAWLEEHHGGRSTTHLTAYGDSTGDREMLLDADVAHWVGREPAPDWLPR